MFGIEINMNTAVAIALVSYATWFYAQNPVVNRGRLDQVKVKGNDEEKQSLKKPPPIDV